MDEICLIFSVHYDIFVGCLCWILSDSLSIWYDKKDNWNPIAPEKVVPKITGNIMHAYIPLKSITCYIIADYKVIFYHY